MWIASPAKKSVIGGSALDKKTDQTSTKFHILGELSPGIGFGGQVAERVIGVLAGSRNLLVPARGVTPKLGADLSAIQRPSGNSALAAGAVDEFFLVEEREETGRWCL